MHPAIAQYRTGIAAICQRYGIRRLEVFGSAARASDFDPAHSDADFLVEFAPGVKPGLHSIFGAKVDLEALLGRGVDLVEPGAVRNPYVLASINQQRAIIFSAEDQLSFQQLLAQSLQAPDANLARQHAAPLNFKPCAPPKPFHCTARKSARSHCATA